MKKNLRQRALAFTRVELIVVVGITALFIFVVCLGAYFLPKAKNRSIRIACINDIKQCALAALVWTGDNEGQFPMAVSNKFGGTLDWAAGGNAFRHFQAMSNELSTPIVVWCPADARVPATNFVNFNNENVSFFVGLDAKQSDPQAWLFGDRNITNGIAPDHTIMTLTSGQSAGWDNQLHDRCANVALADGSVKQLSNADLQRTLKETAVWTNGLALPE